MYRYIFSTRWRHQMETFSALLAPCAGNSPITGEFPSQKPVTRFVVFFDLCLNKRVNNREAGALRRHRAQCDVIVMSWGIISLLYIGMLRYLFSSIYFIIDFQIAWSLHYSFFVFVQYYMKVMVWGIRNSQFCDSIHVKICLSLRFIKYWLICWAKCLYCHKDQLKPES